MTERPPLANAVKWAAPQPHTLEEWGKRTAHAELLAPIEARERQAAAAALDSLLIPAPQEPGNPGFGI